MFRANGKKTWHDGFSMKPVRLSSHTDRSWAMLVTQIRTEQKMAILRSKSDSVKPKRLPGGETGHLKKMMPHSSICENSTTNQVSNLATKLMSPIEVGKRVDVIGISKGKGFAGGVKRYHFKGGPKTHGQSDRLRAPGSNSATTTPGRVYKGSRRPGHMGSERVTSSNVKVVLLDVERNLLGICGSIPGPRGGLVVIKEARKQ